MVTKITSPVTPLEVIGKVNEIIDDFTLDNLTNVSISSPSAGQNLTYDATNQVWKNTSSSATVAWGGITGTLSDQSDLNNALNGKVPTSRAINSKALTSDITLTASDVGALPDSTVIPTVDQTYSASSTNAQSGVAINGANFLVNNAAGSTNGVAVKGSGGVQSTQIGALGSAASMSTSVGFSAYATGSQAITIGHGSQATAAHSYSFGEQAISTAKGAFQFGYGTNNEAGTVQFGLNTGDENSATVNYKLLGADGLIPDARLSSNIARTSAIPTVNNATLTITQGGTTKGTFTANASSDVTIALDSGGGSVDVDNSTITLNSSNQIQTVAVKDNRSGNSIKTWTGTRSQYDAITTKDSNTLYNITDDTDVTLTLLNTLYPVGAIYIGTMNACPLQALGVGTWTLVSSGRVLQGVGSGQTVGTTVEAGLPNINFTLNPGSNAQGSGFGATSTVTGCANLTGSSSTQYVMQTTSSKYIGYTLSVDASSSNSIYGNSTTVQPPAYLVNIWERIQ